jgi:hypothetical protein
MEADTEQIPWFFPYRGRDGRFKFMGTHKTYDEAEKARKDYEDRFGRETRLPVQILIRDGQVVSINRRF